MVITIITATITMTTGRVTITKTITITTITTLTITIRREPPLPEAPTEELLPPIHPGHTTPVLQEDPPPGIQEGETQAM